MEDRIARIEEAIEKMSNTLLNHISESSVIREKVERHDKKLENGWANELQKLISSILERLTVIETKIETRNSHWKDISMALGMIATIATLIYTVVRISSL